MPHPVSAITAGLAAGVFALASGLSAAAEPLSGQAVAAAVDARPSGDGRVRTITMALTNARGQTRTRVARAYHRAFEDATRVAIFFTEPAAIADTAFSSADYDDAARDDTQWLFLPATERVRAIPASERGDSFMGTDFSYDDIDSNLKLGLDDYTFTYVEERAGEDGPRHVIRATPVDEQTRDALGYGEAVAVINPANWMLDSVDYADVDGAPLKTITVEETAEIEGVWTALRVRADNHQTGHHTLFTMSDVAYVDGLTLEIFDKDALEFGAPELD